MHHHPPIHGPKSDHPASGERSYPVYPVLPQSDAAPPPQGNYGYSHVFPLLPGMNGHAFEGSFLMKRLGCVTLLMVLLVLACVVKATLLQAHALDLATPTIPASCVAVGQPRMDPHHSVQLVRCG